MVADAQSEAITTNCADLRSLIEHFNDLSDKYINSGFDDIDIFLQIDAFAQTHDLPTPPTS